MPASEDRLTWTDEIPPLAAIYERGGVPGFDYLYCTCAREREAQDVGYTRIPASPVFRVIGPKGQTDFVVMRRPLPILDDLNASIRDKRKVWRSAPGVEPETYNNPVSVDTDLLYLTGLEERPTPTTNDPKPSKKAEETARGAA